MNNSSSTFVSEAAATSLENDSSSSTITTLTMTFTTSNSIETVIATESTSSWDAYTTTHTAEDLETTTRFDAIQKTMGTSETVYYATEATTSASSTTTTIMLNLPVTTTTQDSVNNYSPNSALATNTATTSGLQTATSSCTPSCSQENGLSVTQIGGIVGGIAIFLILCGLFIFCKKERRSKHKDATYNSRASQYVYHQDMKESIFSQEDNNNNNNIHRTIIDVPDATYSNYVPQSLYPRRDNSSSPNTSFTTTTVVDPQQQNDSKSSVELDTDNYTYSAMDIFNNHQGLYRPSLNESILSDIRPSPSLRSRESTLDPHLLLDKKKSLWDDQV